MKKHRLNSYSSGILFAFILIICFSVGNQIFAQTSDYSDLSDFSDLSDDVLFGSSDISGDDDFFGDDSVVAIEETQSGLFSDEVNRGEIFETGSIKIGGTFTTSIDIKASLYSDDKKEGEENAKSFGERLSDSTLTPKAEALLYVDARPTKILRMYTKFGLAYPFKSSALSSANTIRLGGTSSGTESGSGSSESFFTNVSTDVTDYLVLKELFTDFSAADRAFFRFGKHTVTWGTGYFFSPVSDMINTSMIDPEDTDNQVDGSLNLRTQITFPGTQNCLWFYIIPSTDFLASGSTESYLKKTAFAAKADLVFGSWELGVGGYYRHEDSPKAMLTASGSLFSQITVFAEGVWQYGTQSEWTKDKSYGNKTSIFFATAGASYYWKTPQITLAAQYYYDGFNSDGFDFISAAQNGNYSDITHNYFTKGHNAAAFINFGRIFGTEDVTANVFAMINFGKEELSDSFGSISSSSVSSETFFNAGTFSAMLNWTPFKNFTVGIGPYLTFENWEKAPTVYAKLSATLGGGKF